jgi:hypothetical protein
MADEELVGRGMTSDDLKKHRAGTSAPGGPPPTREGHEIVDTSDYDEGPPSGGKVAMFALAIAVVLGAVFYGLNNSSMNQPVASPAAQKPAAVAAPADATKSK